MAAPGLSSKDSKSFRLPLNRPVMASDMFDLAILGIALALEKCISWREVNYLEQEVLNDAREDRANDLYTGVQTRSGTIDLRWASQVGKCMACDLKPAARRWMKSLTG
jgi:hypothetical protein